MDWLDTIRKIAPTVASVLAGPAAGMAVSAIGAIIGDDSPTVNSISKAITDGKLTADHLAEIRKLEIDYTNQEKERGFKYAELEFKDRDSARQMAIETHSITPSILTWIIVGVTLVMEAMLLFNKVPPGVDPIIMGRVLGTMDSALMLSLSFWFGSNSGSARTKELLAQAQITK